MTIEPPGLSANMNELVLPKARALASYLESDKHPFAKLIEIRRDASGVETVVLDVVVELSQVRVNQILGLERLAASFEPADEFFPEVLSLRDDFPWVPHLNQRDFEFPRSLCLYERPYDTEKLRWTPTIFVERIRQWLSLTSEGKLHQEDQPLENIFLGQFPPLILPSSLVKSIIEDGNDAQQELRLGVHAVGENPQQISGFVVTNPKMHGVLVRPDHVVTAVVAPPRKHGFIRKTPKTLRQVIDVMQALDVDLLQILKERLRQWKETDANMLGARVLLLLIFPKYREEGRPEETYEWDISGFLLRDPVRETGAKLGLWQVTDGGTLAMLIGGEDHSANIGVQIVNPVTQLTRLRAALFSGTQPDDRKMVMIGVGALGSMTFENFVRKGFGTWGIIDDDLLMPHNAARHALTSIAAGEPKVTAMKQMIETLYEEAVVTNARRINVLHPGSQEAVLISIFDEADVILDCSADVAVARQIALEFPRAAARRLSLFLSPDGEQLVLLLEDKNREIKLDALEMQFYRLLLDTASLQNHYASVGPKIRYGRSCRDLSAVLSADSIAAFAGIASKTVERLLRSDAAALAVWKIGSNDSIEATSENPRREFRLKLNGFTVVWDAGVLDKLRWLRGEKLHNETGGALLGSWDLGRQILYIVDITGAPEDSSEYPTAFIRGSKDLCRWIAESSRITGHSVEYVGEWHSHPNGYSTNPSTDDRNLFRWIEEHLSIDGLPPAMLIVGETELRWLTTVDGSGIAWKYPN